MSAYNSADARTLTPAVVRDALDRLWNHESGRADPLGAAIIRSGETLRAALPEPDQEWAVEAGGWRLVIYDGAIAGIEEIAR